MSGGGCLWFGEFAQPRPITRDQRFLLRARPALEVTFNPERLIPALILFGKYEFHRTTLISVAPERARLVSGQTRFKIVGNSRVVRLIRAANNVEVKTHYSIPNCCL